MDIGLIILFVVIMLTIYGGLHYYTYRKLIAFCPGHKKTLVTLLVLLAISLFAGEMLTHNGFGGIAYPIALIAYIWMGLVFLFVIISGVLDIVQWFAGLIGPLRLSRALRVKRRTLVVGVGVVLLGLSGYISGKNINVRTIDISSDKVANVLRVVQISDLHLGILSDPKRIEKLTELVNELNADVIVSTGDLVDMQLDHIKGLAEQLSGMKARLGKYAVLGNHEIYASLDESIRVIERAGFLLLSNSGVSPQGLINFVGVDDPAVTGHYQRDDAKEAEFLDDFANGLFTVLLKHQPRVDPASMQYFDLQLSGHTHGGQIFPFGLLTKLFYPVDFGLSLVARDTWLYVSRGTGTWGPPMRILAPAEVTLFRIMGKS